MTLIPNGRASGKVHFAGRCVRGPRGIAAAPLPSIGVLPPMSVMLDLAAFTRLRFRETGRKSWKRSCARVAERQTRWLQVPVSERAWGFKSPLAHAITQRTPVFGPGFFCVRGPASCWGRPAADSAQAAPHTRRPLAGGHRLQGIRDGRGRTLAGLRLLLM